MPILIKQLNSIPCNLILTMGLHPTQAILNKKINKYSDYVGKIFDIEIGTRTVIDYELCAFAKVLDTTADELLKDFRDYLDKKLKN